MYVRKTHEICPVGLLAGLSSGRMYHVREKEMMCGQLIGSIGLINNLTSFSKTN